MHTHILYWHTRLEKETYSLLRCPTCMEVTTSLKYCDWLSSDMPAHLRRIYVYAIRFTSIQKAMNMYTLYVYAIRFKSFEYA